jgi:drug/metabolite transporter (DMT)-like permease
LRTTPRRRKLIHADLSTFTEDYLNKYWIAFWIVSCLYGSSFLFNSIALRDLSPIQLGTLRYAIAAIALNIYLVRQGRQLPLERTTLVNLFLVGVGNHAIPFILILWAQTKLDSGLTSVFMATVPLYSLVIAHFAYADERINVAKVAGIFLGFVGVIILASRDLSGAGADSHLDSILAVIVASALSAAATIYSRHAMRGRMDAMTMATGTMSISALFMFVVLFALPVSPFNADPAPSTGVGLDIWLVVLTLGLVNTLVANTLYYYVVTGLGASRSTLVTYVFPPISLALGAIFLHEVIDIRIVLGTLIIFSGLALSTMNAFIAARRPRLIP